MSKTTRLRLVQYGDKDANGLYPLRLIRQRENGEDLGAITVRSGAPGKQTFRKAENSPPGSMEPIPEGKYVLGILEWAGGPGNYNASWGPGLGPVWVSIDPAPGLETRRASIGFHIDENRAYAPGSAGCVVFPDLPSLQKFVSWFSDAEGRPVSLTVDWGLGTVDTAPVDPLDRIFVWHHDGILAAKVNGKMVKVVGVKENDQPWAGAKIEIAYRKEGRQ